MVVVPRFKETPSGLLCKHQLRLFRRHTDVMPLAVADVLHAQAEGPTGVYVHVCDADQPGHGQQWLRLRAMAGDIDPPHVVTAKFLAACLNRDPPRVPQAERRDLQRPGGVPAPAVQPQPQPQAQAQAQAPQAAGAAAAPGWASPPMGYPQQQHGQAPVPPLPQRPPQPQQQHMPSAGSEDDPELAAAIRCGRDGRKRCPHFLCQATPQDADALLGCWCRCECATRRLSFAYHSQGVARGG